MRETGKEASVQKSIIPLDVAAADQRVDTADDDLLGQKVDEKAESSDNEDCGSGGKHRGIGFAKTLLYQPVLYSIRHVPPAV